MYCLSVVIFTDSEILFYFFSTLSSESSLLGHDRNYDLFKYKTFKNRILTKHVSPVHIKFNTQRYLL